jgi:hypothetical protein
MKTYITAMVLFVVGGMFAAQAQDLSRVRVGANGGLSLGGDVEKTKPAYGAQAELDLTKHIGVELAVSRFSDEATEEGIAMDLDLTTIGLSVVGRVPLVRKLQGVLLAGVDYNMMNFDVDIGEAASHGIPMTADVDMDDAVGIHVGGGLSLPFHTHWELFTEFRYTFVEFEGDMSVTGNGVTVLEHMDKSDYDFGLLKVGLNYLF